MQQGASAPDRPALNSAAAAERATLKPNCAAHLHSLAPRFQSDSTKALDTTLPILPRCTQLEELALRPHSYAEDGYGGGPLPQALRWGFACLLLHAHLASLLRGAPCKSETSVGCKGAPGCYTLLYQGLVAAR